MADIKRIIEEEKSRNRQKENDANERFRNSKVFQRDRSNDSKAEKLLTFALPVLRKFAREFGREVEYKGTHSGYGDCIACYELVRYEGFFGRKRLGSSEIIIGLRGHKSGYGYIAGGVLSFGYYGLGEQESFDEINEEWFIRALAKQFANLP